MASIFSKIISGEIPSFKIYEDEFSYAFLDINPVSKGHCLVVPKEETDYIFDLDDVVYQHLFKISRIVSVAIEKVVPCERVGIAVVGLEVPHAHIHLIPINGISDFSFEKPKVKMEESEFSALAKEIAKHVKV